MCEALSGLRGSFSGYAARFDPALITAGDAARVVADSAAIEKMAATVKALAAARVADTGVWRDGGDRTAAHHLARITGTTVGAAAEALSAARRLDALPATAAAARRGELSAAQVATIADAASADPDAERRLVDQARRSSLQELKDDCARTRAAAVADAETRRRRVHARRYLRTYTDAEGAWNLHVRNTVEVGAEIMATIDGMRDRLFAQARTEGRREPSEAYGADALSALVGDAENADSVSVPARTRTKVIVRVDLAALLRGQPVSGEVAELVGYGPVAVSAIRDMIGSGDPFLAAVATRAPTWSASPTSGVSRRRTSRRRWNGSTPPAQSRAVTPWPAWRWTIATIGLRHASLSFR